MKSDIYKQIIDLLKTHECWFETFEHAPVRTSEEASALRPNYSIKQGAKAIIVRAKIPNQGKKFVMLVLPGDQKFNGDKVKGLLGAKDIRFATEEEVKEITKGVQPGGVPPFGNLFGLEVLSDPTLFDNQKIIFNATRIKSIAMMSKDYKTLVEPTIEDII